MKKYLMMAATVAATLTLNSCGGLGTAGNALGSNGSTPTAQGTLGSLAGALTGSNGGSSVLGTVLSSLLGNKTTQNSIVGTWKYAAPKVTFESENVLAKLGSSVVSNKVESTLGSQLGKIGFTAGKTAFTFNQDGTCTMTIGSKTTKGTYTYNQQTSQMTLKGALGVASLTCTVSVVGGEMYMLFDADKLLSVITGVSSKVSAASTLNSLLKNYNGLQLGWTMKK